MKWSETWDETLSLKTITKELDFLRKTATFQWNAWKGILLLANKLIEKIPDLRNAKENYQSFITQKKHKISKTIISEIMTYQPKTSENSSIVDIKSVITGHPKTSHRSSKTIRQAIKVGSNSPLYGDTKK